MLQICLLLPHKQSKEDITTADSWKWTIMCVLFFICTCSRSYRACLQRTLVCSLLTGALLEATAALGARSALPCPSPQGPNGHAVLKGRCIKKNVMLICVFKCANQHVQTRYVHLLKRRTEKLQDVWNMDFGQTVCMCLILRRKGSHYSPVVCCSILYLSLCSFPTWFFLFAVGFGSAGARL